MKVYFTIITWPQGAVRADVVDLIEDCFDLDRRSVELNVGSCPPRIFGLVDPAPGRAAAERLAARGGDAFMMTTDDLAALGPTVKVRDLAIEPGGLRVEPWRGEACVVDPADIEVVVRAQFAGDVGTSPLGITSLDETGGMLPAGLATTGLVWGMGGAFGVALGLYGPMVTAAPFEGDGTTPVRSHKLDFHTRGGTVFQIDGDKFAFGVLGDRRGPTDHVNIQLLCELLVHLSPDVVVDPYFAMWKPPPAYQRLRLPMMKLNNEDPAFAFYSRWAALLYRHVMG